MANTKKPAVKRTATKAAPKSAAKKAAPSKRDRKKVPLYATVKLSVLKELVKDDDDADIVVSRNFVIETKKKQLEDQAQLELGI
jgi:hypothetical protein|tara:strand:- start:3569 stop:3820 length:252 start_codon:yes stop_codon:yes gene_type:complete